MGRERKRKGRDERKEREGWDIDNRENREK